MLTRHDHAAHPDDAAFTRTMVENAQFGSAYRESGDVAGMRAATERLLGMPFVRRANAALHTEAAQIGGVAGEWIGAGRTGPDPTGGAGATKRGTLVFFHGGGYVRGSLALGRSNAADLAAGSGLRCFSVAYRQAPEHPFPAPIEDAVAVCQALGAGGGPVLLAGESAGGGIVLAAAMRLRELGGPPPAAIAAISPFFDLTQSGASWQTNAQNDLATRAMAQRLVHLYMGGRDLRQPLASPLFGSFGGLAPLFVAVGGHEVLLSESEALARRAADSGVNTTLEVFEAMPHGFTKYRLHAAAQALQRVAAWLARHAG